MSKKSFKPLSKLTKTESFRVKQKQTFNLTSLPRLICIGCLSFLLTLSSPFINHFPLYSPSLQVLAQSNDAKKAQADKLLNQGVEQAQTSQFEAALKSFQQALDIYQEIKDREGESAALGNFGAAYGSMGNYPKAIAFFEQRLKIAQETKDREGEGNALGNLGVAYGRIEDYPKAIGYYERFLKIAQEIKDRDGEGNALTGLGDAYLSMGDYPKAIDYHKQRLKIAQEIKDRDGEGNALNGLGNAYFSMGDYPKAIDYHEQRLKIAQEIKDRKGEGHALTGLGNAYLIMGDYPKAIDYHEQRLKIAQEIKDRKGEGAALVNLGGVYGGMGDYPKAIVYQQQSLKIFQEIKNRNGEGTVLGNLGNAYYNMGDYPKAIDYQEQYLKIAQEIKDRNGEGQALGNLGNAYEALGDYLKAIEYQQRSLKIAQEIKDRNGEGTALGNLGNAYQALGDYPKAIDYQEQYLKIAQEIKDRKGEGTALGNLGNAYARMGDYPKALKYQQRSLKINQEIKDRNGEGNTLGNLGVFYYFMGDYPKAIEYLQRSLKITQEIKNRSGEGSALGNLGNAYNSLGEYPKAIDYHKRDLKIAQEIKYRLGEGSALNNLGVAYYKTGNLQLAENTLFDSIKVKESLRGGLKDNNKITIFDTQRNTYRLLQEVLIAQNKIDAALLIAERGRARAFVELLTSKLSSHPSEKLSTPPNIEQIKQIASAQNATLVQYSIMYDDFKVEGKLQKQESEIYIWVIKPTGEVTFRKSDLKPLWQKENTELAQLVINSRSSIGARGRGLKVSYNPGNNASTPKNNLKRLHELLVEPIADLLPTSENDKVIFIPQDSLFLVPFPALLDSNNKFLIEKHTILTSPAIQVLDLTGKQKQKVNGNGALVVGNPTMSAEVSKNFQLSPLPGAEKEAIEIAKILNTQPLLTNKATKAEVLEKMPTARIIHLATHGLIDDIKNFNIPGAVVLAPDGKDNGLLTSGEILDLKLSAELVVLSACDTGTGKLTGDGVIGLSRSLITAGTPSVIVTLWKIPDASSKILMTDFYRNLSQNSDKALALRKAMLNTMKQYPDPVDWAAFTLIGEAK